MFNEHPLDEVQKLLNKTPHHVDHTQLLCAIDQQLQLVPYTHPRQGVTVIATIRPSDIANGLTSAKWDLIERRIRFHVSKGQLCLPDQEPSPPTNPSSSLHSSSPPPTPAPKKSSPCETTDSPP